MNSSDHAIHAAAAWYDQEESATQSGMLLMSFNHYLIWPFHGTRWLHNWKNDQPVTNKLSAIITRMYFVFMISNDYVSSWIYDQNSYSNPLCSRPFEDFKNSLIELGLPVGVCKQMCKWRVESKPVYESNLFDELARKLLLRGLAGLTSLLFMQWNKKKIARGGCY